MANPPNGRSRLLRLLIILAAVAASVVLAGCSGDDDSGDDGAGAGDPAGSTTGPSSPVGATTSSSTPTSEPTTSEPTTGGQGSTVEVFHGVEGSSDCGDVQGFERTITDGDDPHLSAFRQLVAGPNEQEVAAGAGSFFSSETADVVTSVVLSDGLLVVDFTDLRPLLANASTSCGSQALLAQLNSTAFQFEEVERARFLIEGSCDDFANWLQRECFDTDRTGRQLDVATNERASGSGCTPATDDSLPAGRWFGFVTELDEEELSFDLACWFTGTAAAAAAAEDGEESPPPNDFHIRNASDQLRSTAVDPSTEVSWMLNPSDPATAEVVDYETWVAERGERSFNPGVWLTIDTDNQVIEIEEQYVP